jgi:PmbA protein
MTARDGTDDLFERTFSSLKDGTRDGEGAELYERVGATLEVTESEDGVEVLESRERGFALRLFRAGRVAFAADGPAGAHNLAERGRLLLPRARARRGVRPPPRLPGEQVDRTGAPAPGPLQEGKARELLALFRSTLMASGEGAVALREATVSLGERSERLATTAGRDATWTSRAATLLATVVGRSAARRFSTRVVAVASRADELPMARLARHAVDRVLLPLSGQPLAPGKADLLLDSHVASHLVGRLAPLFFGEEEEALLLARTRRGRDPFASPCLSLVDDAAAPGGPIRTTRDGEGTPQNRTLAVDRGVPAGRLTDLSSAARREMASSGNAQRRAWSEPPTIGVTNFFVDPSPGVSPLDLLADVQRGYYAAVLLERPEVDLAANTFRLNTAGYWIEKGRAAGRVSEAAVHGRLSDLLRGVAAIGDDLKFVAGAGGGVGSPTLYVPRWKYDS